jgi:hypothetical protein
MLRNTLTYNGLLPKIAPERMLSREVRLPYGGPFGTGGPYLKGTVLGSVSSATAANEVRTYAVSGSPTGVKVAITFTAGDQVYTASTANAASTVMTAAELVAALEEIFGAGNIGVVKSTLSYAITFQGALANTRIGGLLTFTPTFTAGTSPAGAFTRTTVGSCGSGQYDVQADGSSDGTQVAKCILRYDYVSGPTGGHATDIGPATQPYSPDAYFDGYFGVADIRNITTTSLATFGRIWSGGSLSDPDAIIKIGV